MSTSNLAVTIESKGNNQWLVRVTRTCADATMAGEVVVKQSSAPSAADAPHTGLAGSMAYLALGKSKLAAGDAQNAVDCAKKGIDELGNDYAAPTVSDDTGMKLLAAQDRIETNHIADGATVMLRMLETRIGLYKQLHADELVN
jgi:hypothetical protein